MENIRKNGNDKMLKFMSLLLKGSMANVVQPLPLLEEKALKRLSTDDYISWKRIIEEWNKVSAEGKKEISKLLFIGSYTMVETLETGSMLSEEVKDTVEYVGQHPEYRADSSEESRASMLDELKSILD